MSLYFIALLPDDRLLEKIGNIKKEIKESYGPRHALKLPPHITIQIPFDMAEELEPVLEESLVNFSRNEEEFEIELSGFGAFKQRVIFIKIKEPTAINELHVGLQEVLKQSVGLDTKEQVENLHPHITLATRDLKKEVFRAIWNEFKNREFLSSFMAKELYVFKHNGKT
ncbi:MAG: 2'-5' RNA ligase family protein, partial [Salinimicrobium sp.]